MNHPTTRPRPIALCLAVAMLAAGCNWLTPLAVLMPPPTKKVPAEYERLAGRRVAVVVWAKPSTLAVFPYARYDTANYVTTRIRDAVAGVEMISASRIEEYLESRPDMEIEPVAVGREFGADAVVFLELLTYQTRDAKAPQMLQGKITASVVAYDLNEDDESKQRYELSTVSVAVPDQPIGALSGDERRIRKETLTTFADAVAQKFVEHEEEL